LTGIKLRSYGGRVISPTIEVTDLAWLEFQKADLDRAENLRP
jgi:hypothetical protein